MKSAVINYCSFFWFEVICKFALIIILEQILKVKETDFNRLTN